MKLAALALALAVTAAEVDPIPVITGRVLMGREYLGGELSELREGWTCAMLRDSRLELAPCELTVSTKALTEEIGMDSLAVNVPGELYFAVRNVDGLRDGPVPALFIGDAPLTTAGTEISLGRYSEDSPRVGVSGTEGAYEITLSEGERRQVLAHAETIDSLNRTVPALLFAGDLDGDGKLDLLLDVSGHPAGSELRLYLSSKAKPGELVHEAARLSVSNC
jgi:hypothetical protein